MSDESDVLEAMRKIIDRAEIEGRDKLTEEELADFKALSDRHRELKSEESG